MPSVQFSTPLRWGSAIGLAAVVMLATLTLPASAQTTSATSLERATSGALRWVDVHMHVLGGLSGRSADFSRALNDAIAEMDRAGVAMAVVLPPPQRDPRFDYREFAAALKQFPGRFAFLGGGGILNPVIHRFLDHSSVTESIKQQFIAAAEQILDDGAAGFGEMAALHISLMQAHPFEEVAADHPLFLALADVAGRRGAVIDLHIDAVAASMATPSNLSIPPHPRLLAENIAGLERLLARDRRARIVWAHGGSDLLGAMTPTLIGRLMDAHSNLFVSLRVVPSAAVENPLVKLPIRNKILVPEGIDPEWLALLTKYSDRFVLGADTFHLALSAQDRAPASTFARGNRPRLVAARELLAALPADLAEKIAVENARRIYRLPDLR